MREEAGRLNYSQALYSLFVAEENKNKVKFTLEHAVKGQMESRGYISALSLT